MYFIKILGLVLCEECVGEMSEKGGARVIEYTSHKTILLLQHICVRWKGTEGGGQLGPQRDLES